MSHETKISGKSNYEVSEIRSDHILSVSGCHRSKGTTCFASSARLSRQQQTPLQRLTRRAEEGFPLDQTAGLQRLLLVTYTGWGCASGKNPR